MLSYVHNINSFLSCLHDFSSSWLGIFGCMQASTPLYFGMLWCYRNCIVIIFWPSVLCSRGILKINYVIQRWVQSQSVQSAACKLSCNKTALKLCTNTEIFWNKKLVSLASPVLIDILLPRSARSWRADALKTSTLRSQWQWAQRYYYYYLSQVIGGDYEIGCSVCRCVHVSVCVSVCAWRRYALLRAPSSYLSYCARCTCAYFDNPVKCQ